MPIPISQSIPNKTLKKNLIAQFSHGLDTVSKKNLKIIKISLGTMLYYFIESRFSLLLAP